MRILLVTDCYYPYPRSGAQLMQDLALELSHLGHTVTVLTPSEFNHRRLEISQETGVTVLRVRTGRIKGSGKITRAFNEARLPNRMWRAGRDHFYDNPCDLIVFLSPTIFFGSLIKKLKHIWRCPTYLILRDIFPQWAVDIGILRKGLAYRWFRRTEVNQYELADIIAVESPGGLNYFAEQMSTKNYKLEILYNWTSDTNFRKGSDYRERLGLTNKVVFLYGGNIGVAQDLDNILRLARSVRNEHHIYFLLVGDGTETGRLQSIIRAHQLTNIRILPSMAQDDYYSLISEFDVGLISLDRKLTTHNFPAKLFSYLAHSLPVLASINPGNYLRNFLEDFNAGLCSLNGDDATLRAHTLALANDARLRRAMGHNAFQLLKRNFSVTAAATQILSHFCDEVARPNGSLPR